MTYTLFYLGKPIYGGWISFTAHLALKYKLPVYKVSENTEAKTRPFGYGVDYRNVSTTDISLFPSHVITAVDKNYYNILHHFPDNTFIVIHDPSEVSKKTSPILLEHLKRFRIITIRESVQQYLQQTYNLPSMFIIHPFYAYKFTKDAHPHRAVSISRIDFDKHTDIILKANQLLDTNDRIELYGAANTQYVFFKLTGLDFNKYYKGKFEKTFEALNDILKDTKYCIDMSVIRHDGGGTQYTFLEAIYQHCALVINKQWIEGYNTPFVDKKNCFVVSNGEELATLLKKDPSVKSITHDAEHILAPHIKVNWIAKLNAYTPKRYTIKIKKTHKLLTRKQKRTD